jgi:hypothetical protein
MKSDDLTSTGSDSIFLRFLAGGHVQRTRSVGEKPADCGYEIHGTRGQEERSEIDYGLFDPVNDLSSGVAIVDEAEQNGNQDTTKIARGVDDGKDGRGKTAPMSVHMPH